MYRICHPFDLFYWLFWHQKRSKGGLSYVRDLTNLIGYSWVEKNSSVGADRGVLGSHPRVHIKISMMITRYLKKKVAKKILLSRHKIFVIAYLPHYLGPF